MQDVSLKRIFGVCGRIAALIAISTVSTGITHADGTASPVPPGPALSVALPFWTGYGRNAQHDALSTVGTNPFTHIKWTHLVDTTHPTGTIYIHYGSPSITLANTVIVPVKTGGNSFRVDAVSGTNGAAIWSANTDYMLPPHDWTPSFSGVITSKGRYYFPGAGGTVWYRDYPDLPNLPVSFSSRLAFYGVGNYYANSAQYNANLYINTPITGDQAGNIYFGVMATGPNPLNISSSVVKMDPQGNSTYVSVESISPDMSKVCHNCAPAISSDGSTLYVTINNTDGNGASAGYLVALRTSNLTTVGRILLKDPKSFNEALVDDDGTASPTVGPDGDVYMGVLENPFPSNNSRGWMLHFDSKLLITKIPAAFGWDDTASIVPTSMVPGYKGPSTYLLCIKYNNYADGGEGNGHNKVAVVDPHQSAVEAVSGTTCMKEILTVLGITPDPDFPNVPGAVREWCINSAAVDPTTDSILVNSEDGHLYRWSMKTNSLVETMLLAPATSEAYTPTLIGPDGTTYAVNDAVLNAVGN